MSTAAWKEANQERMKAYRREYYYRNSASEKVRIRERTRKLRSWYQDYKKGLSCIVCGENDPWCLDFHHRDPETKALQPSKIWTMGWSIERMTEELEKCDVLCSNCHRKLHHKKELLV